MVAFAVKHIVGNRGQGSLVSILKGVRIQPYSLTSKSREAKLAALGCNVYVIEVIRPAKKKRFIGSAIAIGRTNAMSRQAALFGRGDSSSRIQRGLVYPPKVSILNVPL